MTAANVALTIRYFDLIKSAMLKFTMQVRIGMMDGIFVAYHNTDRIFGFQSLPL